MGGGANDSPLRFAVGSNGTEHAITCSNLSRTPAEFRVKSSDPKLLSATPSRGVVEHQRSTTIVVKASPTAPDLARLKLQVLVTFPDGSEHQRVFRASEVLHNSNGAMGCEEQTSTTTTTFDVVLVFGTIDVPTDGGDADGWYSLQWRRGARSGTTQPAKSVCGRLSLPTPLVISGCQASTRPDGKVARKYAHLTLHRQGEQGVLQQIGDVAKLDVSNHLGGTCKGVLTFGKITLPVTMSTVAASTQEPTPTPPPDNPLTGSLLRDSPISVFVRVRPPLTSTSSPPVWDIDRTTVGAGSTRYVFNGVIDESSDNAMVFSATGMAKHVDNLLGGINGTVCVYGQTSSGKTHTMFGREGDPGLVPRTVHHLFAHAAARSTKVTVSFCELYNEEVFDLLNTGGGALPVREDKQAGGFVVRGMTSECVASARECLEVLARGMGNRTTGFSHLNERSSRAHTIFRLECEGKDVRGQLNLVDLAGSESFCEKGGAVQQKETASINLSLTHMKKVISELSRGERFVSYRSSTLTKVLKLCLGGNACTTIVCTITQAEEHFRESKSTLLFGTTAKAVTNRVRVNARRGEGAPSRRQESELQAARDTIKDLEQEMAKMQARLEALEVENAHLRSVRSAGEVVETPQGDASSELETAQQTVSTLQAEVQALQANQPVSGATRCDARGAMEEVVDKQRKMDTMVEDIIKYLEWGTPCGRVEGTPAPHRSWVCLSNRNTLLWHPQSRDGTPNRAEVTCTVQLEEVQRVQLGFHGSCAFDHLEAPFRTDHYQSLSLSISLPKRDVGLLCAFSKDHEAWVLALDLLLPSPVVHSRPMPLNDLPAATYLDPDESATCSAEHIHPVDYMNAKAEAFSDYCNLTVHDLRATTALDLHQAKAVLQLFAKKGWVVRTDMYVVDPYAVPSDLTAFDVEIDDDGS